MAKQKVVIRVSMKGSKQQSKALTIAVGFPGVASAGIGGDDKDQVVVTGEGFDSAKLTLMLRKKMGCAEIVSVAVIKPETAEEKLMKNCKKMAELCSCSVCLLHAPAPPNQYWYDVQEPTPLCTLM